jgi:hypothetical protein
MCLYTKTSITLGMQEENPDLSLNSEIASKCVNVL